MTNSNGHRETSADREFGNCGNEGGTLKSDTAEVVSDEETARTRPFPRPSQLFASSSDDDDDIPCLGTAGKWVWDPTARAYIVKMPPMKSAPDTYGEYDDLRSATSSPTNFLFDTSSSDTDPNASPVSSRFFESSSDDDTVIARIKAEYEDQHEPLAARKARRNKIGSNESKLGRRIQNG